MPDVWNVSWTSPGSTGQIKHVTDVATCPWENVWFVLTFGTPVAGAWNLAHIGPGPVGVLDDSVFNCCGTNTFNMTDGSVVTISPG